MFQNILAIVRRALVVFKTTKTWSTLKQHADCAINLKCFNDFK